MLLSNIPNCPSIYSFSDGQFLISFTILMFKIVSVSWDSFDRHYGAQDWILHGMLMAIS